MSKHTRGPWTLKTVTTSCGICHKVGPFPGKEPRKEPRHAFLYADYPSEGNPADEELAANARLIAAAPDMYEALELLYDHARLYRPEVESNNVGVTVRAALAKAKGGEMSTEIQRYTCADIRGGEVHFFPATTDQHGDLVLYEDYLAAVEKLRARCAELERDAKRLDWAEQNALFVDALANPDNHVKIWHDVTKGAPATGRTLREAIDAALAAGGKG